MERVNGVLYCLVSTRQDAYIKSKFIGESGRLISDIADVFDRNNIGEYLVIVSKITQPDISLYKKRTPRGPHLSLCVHFMSEIFIHLNQK